MPESYCCENCDKYLPNIIDYCDHVNSHCIEKNEDKRYHISTKVLQYFIDNEIDPSQYLFEEYIPFEDHDILWMVVNEYYPEFAIEVLDLIKFPEKRSIHKKDDDDRLREYLYEKGIISDKNCDLYEVACGYEYNDWDNFIHNTQDDILMLCIKKKWNNFCLRLLDLDFVKICEINYKDHFTNPYELALKYELYDVAEKIKKDKRFIL